MAWPAWLLDLWSKAKPYADRAAVWRGYEAEITSLTILTVGIALYTLLVFTFYRNLSKRAAFHSDVGKGTWWGKVVHALESTFVFPVMSFLYFSVLAASLFFLAKSQSTYQILLLAMAVVAGVRLTAFVTESAAGDLARLLPLSLLGVMIVDPTYSTWGAIWARYKEVVTLLPLLGRFFLLFLVFETALRVWSAVLKEVRARTARRSDEPAPAAEASVRLEVVDTAEIADVARPKAP